MENGKGKNKIKIINLLALKDLLNELCSQQYMGVVCREFTQADVADGAWFKLSEPERARMAQTSGHWPFIVNNNFYVGVQNKMAR
jgi:hypothetical protein